MLSWLGVRTWHSQSLTHIYCTLIWLSVTLKGLSYLLRSHLWLYSARRLFVTKELARVSSKDGEVPESLGANLVDEC